MMPEITPQQESKHLDSMSHGVEKDEPMIFDNIIQARNYYDSEVAHDCTSDCYNTRDCPVPDFEEWLELSQMEGEVVISELSTSQ